MIFKRTIYEKLKEWKETSADSKALMIEGARRIGKTTICKEFAEREYKSYLLIDFNTIPRLIKRAFTDYLNDLDTFYMMITAYYHVELYPHESLIIFDEIQRYPRAREAIKYLVQDGRYHFIETGSLISIHESVKKITTPSEERRIQMYPMTYEEFLWALGEDVLAQYIRDCYNRLKPLDSSMHQKAMHCFRQYMLVGGMPKVVDCYISNQLNFFKAELEKEDILASYRDDIGNISNVYRKKVQAIFSYIPTFLSKHEKRVRFSVLGTTHSSAPIYDDSFYWLKDSMIANLCFLCTDPNIGLKFNSDNTFLKCYMGDTGLLSSLGFADNTIVPEEVYRAILSDNLSINEGMLYENAVAQALVSSGHNLFYYKKYAKHSADDAKEETDDNDDDSSDDSEMEVDFIIPDISSGKPKISPIEVKSSKNYTTVSLDLFNNVYHSRISKSYIIHPKNLSVKGSYIYLPVYMAGLL